MTTSKEYFTLEQVIQSQANLLADGRLRYFAKATTPWNALGVTSYIHEKHPNENGVVMLSPYPPHGYLIGPDHFKPIIDSTKFVYIKESTNKLSDQYIRAVKKLFGMYRSSLINKKEKRISLVAPQDRFLPLSKMFAKKEIGANYMPKYISIDSGLGEYINPKSGPKRDDPSKIGGKVINNIYDSIINYSLRRLSRVGNYHDRALYNLNNGALSANTDILESYKSILPEVSPGRKNIALILTQPFSELGIISPEIESAVMNGIITDLIDEYQVVIKTHPRENQDKYDQLVDDPNISAYEKIGAIEKEIVNISPKLTIGFTSGALLNCSVLHNIPALSIARKFFDFIDNNRFRSDIVEYQKLVGGHVGILGADENILHGVHGIIDG